MDAMIAAKKAKKTMAGFQNMANKPMNMVSGAPTNMVSGAPTNQVEGFESYYLENAGGAKEQYAPVGAFDGVKLSTGNNVSDWLSLVHLHVGSLVYYSLPSLAASSPLRQELSPSINLKGCNHLSIPMQIHKVPAISYGRLVSLWAQVVY